MASRSFTEPPPRLFHRVTLAANGRNLVGVATDLCAADRFDSRYELRANGSFTIVAPRWRTVQALHQRHPRHACAPI